MGSGPLVAGKSDTSCGSEWVGSCSEVVTAGLHQLNQLPMLAPLTSPAAQFKWKSRGLKLPLALGLQGCPGESCCPSHEIPPFPIFDTQFFKSLMYFCLTSIKF